MLFHIEKSRSIFLKWDITSSIFILIRQYLERIQKMEQWEKNVLSTLTDESILTKEERAEIRQMEKATSVDMLMEKYADHGEDLILKNMLRWKIMKNLCIREPRLNFSNEVIEKGLELTLECPSECIPKIKEWIDEKIDTKTLFNFGPFNAFVNTDRGLKNFWYILSEVANA